MKHIYFMTGFPGFLAGNMLRQLVHDHKGEIGHIHLLVLPAFLQKAEEDIRRMANSTGTDISTFSIIAGDITKPDLDMEPETLESLERSVTHVFHFAAVYDLAVPAEIAWKVNVTGTAYVNAWTKTLRNLKRYAYFSTAYVSGKREGRIYENELSEGQGFKNHYEETKYEAELLVEELKKVLPVTIFRPGIVKGNSITGVTVKFDGIYFLLNLFDRLRLLPAIPYMGEGTAEGNFVPSDYVLQAASYLAIDPVGQGKTYHLTDPNPYRMKDIYRMIAEAYLGRRPKGSIPLSLAKFPLTFAVIRKWLGVEKEALDYFLIDSSYDCSQTVKDLEDSGIECPDLKDTIRPMIDFYERYKHDRTKHIDIQ